MSEPSANERGVLIADDDETIRRLFEEALPGFGFRVWVAGDGIEALTIYRQEREAIDVVLLDLNMPRLSGPQTLTALQRENPAVCCVFMTGGSDYQHEDLFRLGAAALLSKPLSLPSVVGCLRQAIRSCERRMALELEQSPHIRKEVTVCLT